MIEFKSIIAKEVEKATNINKEELETYIETPKDYNNGDYAFPCFKLAKVLKKSPQIIANEIKEKIKIDNKTIEKVEVAGGYLNFYINKELLAREVLQQKHEIAKIGNGKNIVIDYSSPNIAKPFHIGHLRTTLIGSALYKIYKYLGYNTIGVNHLGDYGTQFGKMIEGYKRWGKEYNIEENPIEELTKIYIRINQACKEDETVLEACRENFKKLENGDEYCVSLWKKFKKLSLDEFNKTYDLLGIKFDSLNGEAFYADKTDEVIKILESTGKLVESEGAKVIFLENKEEPPFMVCKANGSTIYATRDLAAILYRARTYDYDKSLYVVAYEQSQYFKQLFEVAKLLGIDEKYIKGLEHVSYGMVHVKNGRMSTREGNVIKVEDLLNETMQRAREIIEEKNQDLQDKEEVAKKVGIGAVIFNYLSTNRVKDILFDWDEALSFQGETGPYIQYTYVRTKSVISKAGKIPEIEDVDFSVLTDKYSNSILKLLYNFEDILKQVTDKNEPSILARYLIELSKEYSAFYNENKIITDDKKVQNSRVYLTYAVGEKLKVGASLLGIDMPNKM